MKDNLFIAILIEMMPNNYYNNNDFYDLNFEFERHIFDNELRLVDSFRSYAFIYYYGKDKCEFFFGDVFEEFKKWKLIQ